MGSFWFPFPNSCCSSVTKSCPTLCDPMDCSLPGSSVHGILQARILEWVAISSSRGSSRPRDQTHISYVSCIADEFFIHWAIREALLCSIDIQFTLFGTVSHKLFFSHMLLLSHFSCVWLCVTPQTAAHQAPPSPGFSRQEHWRGLPLPSPMHACILSHFSRVRLCVTHGQQPTRLLYPQDSLGKNTGVGCHFLLHFLIYFTNIQY